MIANVMLAATRRAGVRVARLHRPYTTAMAFRDGAPGSVTSQALTANELRDFERDGFVLRRKMFDASETSLLQQAARSDKLLEDNTFSIADGEGGKSDLTLWRSPGEDIYGMVMRCARLVRSAEAILQEEVYHYQTKLMRKDPETGGAFPWHQDYGWWYADGVLRPKLVTAFLAVDPCTVENGALQVIKGSHDLGRLSHGLVGGQQGVGDMERVTAIRKTMKTEFMEMDPGDVVFLNSNLLHRSKANRSTVPRWALLVSYNAVSNVPYKIKDGKHEKLQVVPDSSVKKIGVKRASDPSLFAKSADTGAEAVGK